ncbi:MAG TPA: mechanosensitive ion channel family protein [Acidimicrobiia bacterium]|nr:mechanosensitive ion channel family protein [Acidimicrobiia bacterium]
MSFGQTDIDLEGLTVQDWITGAVIVGVTIVLAIAVRRLTSRILRRVDMDPGPARLVGRFFAFIVVVAGFVYSLNALEIAIGPVLGALGVGGLALAFALQDIIENLIAGIMLQTRRPFRIGDQVVVGGYEGQIEDVSLRSTLLRTYDGRRVFVPSADVLKNAIENNTAFDRRRTTLLIGVAYDTDLESARRTILEALEGVDAVLTTPEPGAFVETFGGSSIDFAVWFWHRPRIGDLWEARHDAAVAIKRAFDAAGIEIPFPIRTIAFSEGTREAISGARVERRPDTQA